MKPKVHNLKTLNPFFDLVKNRVKRFEIRKNDRDFKVGDFFLLEEFVLTGKQITGRKIIVLISNILQDEVKFCLRADFCVLSLKFREEFTEEEIKSSEQVINDMF